jgi:hypothetical protein
MGDMSGVYHGYAGWRACETRRDSESKLAVRGQPRHEPQVPPCTPVVDTVRWSLVTHARRRATPSGRANPSSMDDCRVLRLRACAVAQPTEAARLDAEAETLLAARAAGQSQWGSELPKELLAKVLELLQWDPAACGGIRAVCSTWCSIHDALRPGTLNPRRSMQGKLSWYQSVTEVDLTGCENYVCGPLAELASISCLRSLKLPARCAERAVDAEAVCGLTALTTLRFWGEIGKDDDTYLVGEWVLDLSRLTSLTCLHLQRCDAVTDEEVLELSNLTGLTDLNLNRCDEVTSEGLRAVTESGRVGKTRGAAQ